MSASLGDDIENSIYEILESHASYIRRGPEDTALHYVPPEVLEALTWMLMNILLPIFTGITASVVWKRLENQDDKELIAMILEKAELQRLKAEVQQLLERMQKETEPNNELILIVKKKLVHVLMVNGWPSDIAEKDTEKILIKIGGLISTEKHK